MPTTVVIEKSTRKDKKYMATLNSNKHIHFGQTGYSDYSQHKDDERKQRYIARHKANEDWTKSGIDTAGFYSKHVLWNKPTISQSITDLNSKYKNFTFKFKN